MKGVYLREVDTGTRNACWIVCAQGDPGAVEFSPTTQPPSVGADEMAAVKERLRDALEHVRIDGCWPEEYDGDPDEDVSALLTDHDAVTSEYRGTRFLVDIERARVDTAEAELARLREENERLSQSDDVAALEFENTTLTKALVAAEAELARVTVERDTFKAIAEDRDGVWREIARRTEAERDALREAAQWAKMAGITLQAYEVDYGEMLPETYELGCIPENRETSSFRIRVGHIRKLAALLNPATEGEG